MKSHNETVTFNFYKNEIKRELNGRWKLKNKNYLTVL